MMKRMFVLPVLLSFGFTLTLCTDEPEYIYVNRWEWLEKDTPPNTGPAPDYSDLTYWAASPHKRDLSDSIPDFLKKEEQTERADVFFIHPTTYVGSIYSKWDDDAGSGLVV
jgi:hypothetical protein